MTGSAPRSRASLAGGLAGCLGVLWIFGGVAVALDWDEFRGVVEQHGVLPDAMLGLLWTAPALQIGVGAGMLLLCTSRFGRVASCVAGLALLAGLTLYLLRVPAEVVQKSGCGCAKPALIKHDKTFSLAWNAGLGVLHGVAVLGAAGRRPAPLTPATPCRSRTGT